MSWTGNLKCSEAGVPPNWSKRRAKVLLVQMRHSPRAPFITHIFADFKYVSYEIIGELRLGVVRIWEKKNQMAANLISKILFEILNASFPSKTPAVQKSLVTFLIWTHQFFFTDVCAFHPKPTVGVMGEATESAGQKYRLQKWTGWVINIVAACVCSESKLLNA